MPDPRFPWRAVVSRVGGYVVDAQGKTVASCLHWADAELIVLLANDAAAEPDPNARVGIVLGLSPLEPTGPDYITDGPVS
jgi:hypothetical protein